jgi:hypothetical protein
MEPVHDNPGDAGSSCRRSVSIIRSCREHLLREHAPHYRLPATSMTVATIPTRNATGLKLYSRLLAPGACRTRCRRVLDIVAKHQCPRVLSVLIDRKHRWRKRWIGEGPYRHGSQSGPAFDLVCDG